MVEERATSVGGGQQPRRRRIRGPVRNGSAGAPPDLQRLLNLDLSFSVEGMRMIKVRCGKKKDEWSNDPWPSYLFI